MDIHTHTCTHVLTHAYMKAHVPPEQMLIIALTSLYFCDSILHSFLHPFILCSLLYPLPSAFLSEGILALSHLAVPHSRFSQPLLIQFHQKWGPFLSEAHSPLPFAGDRRHSLVTPSDPWSLGLMSVAGWEEPPDGAHVSGKRKLYLGLAQAWTHHLGSAWV